tara:strand:+ start:423 stop:590 length:168 start_codon:yes stop_codon:yes gene_type:complete
MEKLYRIEELCTDGWSVLDDKAVKLTRDQAKARLDEAIAEGLNPNRLRAIPDRNV